MKCDAEGQKKKWTRYVRQGIKSKYLKANGQEKVNLPYNSLQKANWIGHIIRRNCQLYNISMKSWRQPKSVGRRKFQLIDKAKEKRK